MIKKFELFVRALTAIVNDLLHSDKVVDQWFEKRKTIEKISCFSFLFTKYLPFPAKKVAGKMNDMKS